jgi:hypothetical protein
MALKYLHEPLANHPHIVQLYFHHSMPIFIFNSGRLLLFKIGFIPTLIIFTIDSAQETALFATDG